MQNTPIAKTSRVARAHERLESAITHLEQAMSARVARDGDAGADAGEAEALRQQNEQLRQLNADAAHRLDHAIGRLGRALAGDAAHDVAAE